MTLDRVVVFGELALGLIPDPALESAIAAYQYAINANSAAQTLLGQEVALLTEIETLNLLMGQPIPFGPGTN